MLDPDSTSTSPLKQVSARLTQIDTTSNRPSGLSYLDTRRHPTASTPPMRHPLSPQQSAKQHNRSTVKQWGADHGVKPTTWDGLRRDPDLWFENGDCRVFLYQRGHSRRGPSFQIPLSCLTNAHCEPLVSALHSLPVGKSTFTAHAELYLPSPDLATREEAFVWHLATRNFFAWLCERPLVGRHLGQSLTDLLIRMRQWRAPAVDCVEDVLIYCDSMRYAAVENSCDHALAMLSFAEANQLRNVWIDAFAHCVGMNNDLSRSSELACVSRRTKALITRAFLEMDLHVDRATQALGTFLEDELSATNLGLGSGARRHLDNFRSMLQTHHVAKYGYWPPIRSSAFTKDLYVSMYTDFSNLYHFLADKESLEPWRSNNGGICVQQTIDAFNHRQKHEPLPYSLPLLPLITPLGDGGLKSQLSLRAFVNTAKENTSRHYRTSRARFSLRAATNKLALDADDPELLQRYVAFEDEQATKPDEHVSLADARRVRWLLIYSVLQTLISIMSAPAEVRSTDRSPYALCILTDGMPPWEFESRASSYASAQQTPVSATFPPEMYETNISSASTPSLTIEPDCEPADFLGPRKSDIPDPVSKKESIPLRKSVSRASFLKRASTLRKRSNSLPPTSEPRPTGFVSGRTLAELAFAQPSDEATCEIPTNITFQGAQDEIELTNEVTNEMKYSSVDLSSPTSDEMQLILPESPVHTLQYASSDTSSVPSLTLSSISREAAAPDPLEFEHALLVSANAGVKRLYDEHSSHGLEPRKGLVKIKGSGVTKTMFSGSLPRSVTKGYDYFERISDSHSTSGTDTPDSLPGTVDRSAVIALDGNVEDEAVELFRAMKT